MFFIVYKTTHIASGKIYIGAHQTKKLDDGYQGSGNILKHAIKKHGRAAFQTEHLFVFDNQQEMFDKEAELVTQEFVNRKDTYNLLPGGVGGWHVPRTDGEGIKALSNFGHEAQAYLAALNPHFRDNQRKSHMGMPKAREAAKLVPPSMLGKHLTEKHKNNIRQTHKDRQVHVGANNSQFGTVWMWKSGELPMKIPSEESFLYLSDGWLLGRHEPTPKKPYVSKSNPELTGTRKGRKLMYHPDHGEEQVQPKHVEKYLADGWVLGRSPEFSIKNRDKAIKQFAGGHPNKGRVRIHNPETKISKLVAQSDVVGYTEKGWLFGMPKLKS